MRRERTATMLAMLTIVAMPGCSGGVLVNDLFGDGGAADGGTDARAGGDAASEGDAGGLASPVCPRVDPGDGAPCARPNLACEYGQDPNANCNAVRTCSSRGVWESRAASALCPTRDAILDPRCPDTYADGKRGASCTAAAADASCKYPAGEGGGRCACVLDPAPDAGVKTKAMKWMCDSPTTSCPTTRPRLGETCVRSGQLCNYGACVLDGGQQLVCLDGYWQRSRFDCPDLGDSRVFLR